MKTPPSGHLSENVIYDIRVMEIADRLIIRYDIKDTLDYATVDAIFGFLDVVKLKNKGSLQSGLTSTIKTTQKIR